MKYFVILIFVWMLPLLPQGFSACAINSDWPQAPCLDTISNGRYEQYQVDRWSDYYSYKGSIFMEEKYLELDEAIKEGNLQEWADESMVNRNVYQYYFFSGRAPNTGEYHGAFDVISVSENDAPEYGKPSFPNMRPTKDYDYGLINMILIVSGVIGAGVAGTVAFIRKRK